MLNYLNLSSLKFGGNIMNASLSLDSARKGYYQDIAQAEVDRLINVSIEHFALPLIISMSMDFLSQADFERMGYHGIKPQPFSAERKITIYRKIDAFLRPILLPIIT